MYIKIPRGWELPERAVTPEHLFLNRRAFLAGAGSIAAAASLSVGSGFGAAQAASPLYPAPRNPRYTVKRKVTPENLAATYNNFYEFGSHKQISAAAQALVIDPWSIKIDGLVEKEQTLDFEDLLKKVTLEERIYRHRCVEAWSMVVPWTGFPLAKLVEIARPLAKAKYIRFETFQNPKVARGQQAHWQPWPYVEGVTLAEAQNELSFMVTGAYGKPAAKQFGAPIRLHLPWKYGFKSIKSIVRISFTDTQPVSFWETIQSREYGFWANVNPEVPHRRWSQASERVLGEDGRIPTQLYNGYGEYVASLYAGMDPKSLYY